MSIYFIVQDYQKVLEYSDKIIASGKLPYFEMASLYHKRGISHLRLENQSACKEDVEQGLAYDNHSSELYLLKGELHLDEKSWKMHKQPFTMVSYLPRTKQKRQLI